MRRSFVSQSITRRSFLDEEGIKILNSLKVPVPKNEAKRLSVLWESMLLDSEPEDKFDRFTALIARILKVYYLKLLFILYFKYQFLPRIIIGSYLSDFSCRY
jgi:hypothetical protein